MKAQWERPLDAAGHMYVLIFEGGNPPLVVVGWGAGGGGGGLGSLHMQGPPPKWGTASAVEPLSWTTPVRAPVTGAQTRPTGMRGSTPRFLTPTTPPTNRWPKAP